MKNVKVKSVILLLIASFTSSFVQAGGVDSFFDIIYTVSYDEVSGSPVIDAQGIVRDTRSGSRKVDTEMLSMSLTSSQSGEGTNHVAVLSYRVSNLGSSGEDTGGKKPKNTEVNGYGEVAVACVRNKCVVTDAQAIDRTRFRGHVTVLK